MHHGVLTVLIQAAVSQAMFAKLFAECSELLQGPASLGQTPPDTASPRPARQIAL